MDAVGSHVFLSYSKADSAHRDEVVRLLEAHGIRVWWAPEHVPPGADYSEATDEAIEVCTAFVVIVSDASNRSRHVRSETQMAFTWGKAIFPVRFSDIEPAKGFRLFLNVRHWTDAFGPSRKTGLDRLARQLAGARVAAPEPSPPPPPSASLPIARPPAGTGIRLPAKGFWSYARRDDELSHGKIGHLGALIIAELEAQLGGEVTMFNHAVATPHGTRWEELTRKALGEATFFIPILTPSFMRSEWCRTEVRLFLEREQELFETYPELRRRSRIFPISFQNFEGAEAADAVVRDTLMKRQHFNFQAKRHLDYGAPEVSRAISNFVNDIRDLLKVRVVDNSCYYPEGNAAGM